MKWIVLIVGYLMVGAAIASQIRGSDTARCGFLVFYIVFGGFVGSAISGSKDTRTTVLLALVVLVCLLAFVFNFV